MSILYEFRFRSLSPMHLVVDHELSAEEAIKLLNLHAYDGRHVVVMKCLRHFGLPKLGEKLPFTFTEPFPNNPARIGHATAKYIN